MLTKKQISAKIDTIKKGSYMQYWYFIKWLFDFTKWEAYQIRYFSYCVIAIVGMFITPWAPVLALMAFMVEIFKDVILGRWTDFQKEKRSIERAIKRSAKSTYKSRVK